MRRAAGCLMLVVWGIAGCGGGGSISAARTSAATTVTATTGHDSTTTSARATVLQDLQGRLDEFEVSDLNHPNDRDMPLPASFAGCVGDGAGAAIGNRSVAALTAPGSSDTRFVSIERRLATSCLQRAGAGFAPVFVSAATLYGSSSGISGSYRACVASEARAAAGTSLLAHTMLSAFYGDPTNTLRRLAGQFGAQCLQQPSTLAAYRSAILSTLAHVAPPSLRPCMLDKAGMELSDADLRRAIALGSTIQGATLSISLRLIRACGIPVAQTP